MNKPGSSLILGLVLLMTVAMPAARASTVLQLDFEEVVHTAAFIFQGKVLTVTPVANGPRVIHTLIEFEVLEVLKGDYQQDTITLTYLGGEIEGRQMQIADMTMPQAGENGFYFVESLDSDMVHPLVGWSQGHYLIESSSDGSDRVQTASGRVIQEVTTSQTQNPIQKNKAFSEGVAAGLVLQQMPLLQSGMSVDAFSQRVREISTSDRSEP